MKTLITFCKKNSRTIETVFKNAAIILLIYSAFRFLARKDLFSDSGFITSFIYSPITEILFWITILVAVMAAIAKYIILRRSLF